MPSPSFFSYLNEMTDNSPMLFEKKTKSCTRFINVDIGLSGSQVAGAAVDARLPLEKVAKQARHASKLVGTMEVALSWCTLPGKGTSDRLGPRSNGAYL